jgi:transposase
MQVMYDRCAGIDVHKKQVTVCVMVTEGKAVKTELKSFGTTTPELLAMSDWLNSFGVTQVGMESTGVYWKPVYNLLEGHFELWLVNAQHIKAVPGRKTDVKDAQWLAQLLRHGLVRKSFVPPLPQRQLRELTRHRSNLVGRRGQVINEVHKILESANLKLGDVATDITGVSARLMLDQIVGGQTDAEVLADLAKGRLRHKMERLKLALQGKVEAHHKIILAQLLAEMDGLEEQILEVGSEIGQRLSAEQELIERLDGIPGVNQRVAQVLIAELGTDMSRFGSAPQLVAWAGMCPGHNESAGKRRSGRTRHGNRQVKAIAVEAAQAGVRKKGSYLGARYRRIAARRGKKRAVVAVGRTILEAYYYMVSRKAKYQDLGEDYFDRRDPERLIKRLSKRIEKLGYSVTVEPMKVAA